MMKKLAGILCLCAALCCASLAQAALTQVEKNELAQLMKKVKVIDDPVDYHRTYLLPQLRNDGYLGMAVYKNDETLLLFLIINYKADHSIDGDRKRPEVRLGILGAYVINVDGAVFKGVIPAEELTVSVDWPIVINSFYIDLNDNPEMYNLVKKIAQSKKTVVRLISDKGLADSTVSREKKQAMAALLRIYELEKKQKAGAEK